MAIRPEIQKLLDRGNIELEEARSMMCTEEEWRAIVPRLTNRALTDQASFILAYINAASMLVPELSERIKSLESERLPFVLPEDQEKLPQTLGVLREVFGERLRQLEKWGNTQYPDGTGGEGRRTWRTLATNTCDRADREGCLTYTEILDEETAEALAEEVPVKLRKELLQVAAVAVQWIESLDRRYGPDYAIHGPEQEPSKVGDVSYALSGGRST